MRGVGTHGRAADSTLMRTSSPGSYQVTTPTGTCTVGRPDNRQIPAKDSNASERRGVRSPGDPPNTSSMSDRSCRFLERHAAPRQTLAHAWVWLWTNSRLMSCPAGQLERTAQDAKQLDLLLACEPFELLGTSTDATATLEPPFKERVWLYPVDLDSWTVATARLTTQWTELMHTGSTTLEPQIRRPNAPKRTWFGLVQRAAPRRSPARGWSAGNGC